MILLGIDPGVNTGVAEYHRGKLVKLDTLAPVRIAARLAEVRPDLLVFEDSRLQSHTWTRGKSTAATAKMARNVGQVDMLCGLIQAVCADLGIEAVGISPRAKGAKLDAKAFHAVTGWTGRCNEHERDAAMVAWPYRAGVRRA